MWVMRLWLPLFRSTVRLIVQSSEIHNYTNCSSAPHIPHTNRIHSLWTWRQYIPLKHQYTHLQHSLKEQDQLFSCFHNIITFQAQCVHNIAASCNTVTATNTPTFKLHSTTNSSQSKLLQLTRCTFLAHILAKSCHFSLCTLHTSLSHTRTHHQMSQAHFAFSLPQGNAPFHTVLYMHCCMLMPCLRQVPVFYPSGTNSYCQTTANFNMWTTTLQSWQCAFYQTDFHFCSYLVSFADCLNFNNMTVFSVVSPRVLASAIHSFTNSVTLYLSTLKKQVAPPTTSTPNHVIKCLLLPLSLFSHFLKVIQLMLTSSSSCFCTFIFHSMSCVRGQFLCKVGPIHLPFIPLYIGCRSLPSIYALHIS